MVRQRVGSHYWPFCRSREIQDKNEDAIKAYDEAIKLDPNDGLTWNNKGEALKSLGRTTEANAAFAKAKELGYKG
jgi:Flp pilus assembly protein TadD